MPRKTEQVLAALATLVEAAVPAARFRRNEPFRVDVPAAGVVTVHDGDPGQPETTLSPLTYHFQHIAEVDVVVQGDDREALFDGLCRAIGAALAADRSLGGLCDWTEAQSPRPVDLQAPGAATFKAGTIPVVLHYWTADPLL